MAILIDERSRVLVQGITGREGALPHGAHARRRHATSSPASSPGKGGQTVDGVPVFDTVAAGRRARPAPTSPCSSCRRASRATR